MVETADTLPIKEILTAASPFIKSVVDTFITPKLEKLKQRFILDKNKYYVPTEEHFSEYFHRTYKRLSVINTLVFNNSQRLLKDIYIPLTIKSEAEREFHYRVEGYPQKVIDKYEKILITDTAGMGKSTLMKKIFIDVIDLKICIPIIIELRRITKDKSILNEILEQLNSIDQGFDTGLLLELIKEGGFLFILDGYDEIALSERETATGDIQNFITKAPANKFILTSRPENALSSFGDFQQFSIEPLKKKEAFELLRKYDRQGNVSSLLIKKLEEAEMYNMAEFLTNPLLVSLLFTAFHHKQAIPFKKYLFYRQVYDANFESHDLTKGDSYLHDKYSKLEIDDFHRVLRYIGFSCFKIQRIEFTKDELLALIAESRKFCVGLKFSDSDFLKDILITVPLFSKDGNYYKWAHKSLQEYFAAQFIYLDSKEQQSKILIRIYNHKELEKFINILDLYYDMDYKLFRNIILFRLLNEYNEFDASFATKIDLTISINAITYRKELCFLSLPFWAFSSGNGFVGDRFDEMMANHKDAKKKSYRYGGMMKKAGISDSLYGLYNINPKASILKLLYNKKHQIVKKIKIESIRPIKFDFSIPEYNLVEITDLPTDRFNSKVNFEHTNSLIALNKIDSLYILKAEKTAKALKEIEESLELETLNDFLLDGI